MKILIVSDTHGRLENLERVIEMTKPIDALIHLGDVEGQEDYIRRLVPCAAYMVSGNNDFFSMLPRELEFELGKYKVLITHGHYYYVSLNTEELRRQARSRRHCDVRAYTQTVSGYGRRDHDLKPGQSVLSETGRTQAKLHDHDHR